MKIQIQGAKEHNLKDVNIDIDDGITVVTGISGSGKTSLVFDTLYNEARRRFLDIYSITTSNLRLSPANVENITGLGPTIAVGQNLLNRNPLSTLATASGLHPFLRLLYANFGERLCSQCNSKLIIKNEDEIVEKITLLKRNNDLLIIAPIVINSQGSHKTLLNLLSNSIGAENIIVDSEVLPNIPLDPIVKHTIEIRMPKITKVTTIKEIRTIVQDVFALGSLNIKIKYDKYDISFSKTNVCAYCGNHLGEIKPLHFHTSCPFCKGKGCENCKNSGLHPITMTVYWNNMTFSELLSCSISKVKVLFNEPDLPKECKRLVYEIRKRLDSLYKVGLGYLSLNRPSPTLSRGESQRVRLAVAISSRLEDMLYVLDEPTIGQHMADVQNFLPIFKDLKGSVIFVEHDKTAAAIADKVIDIGPKAGLEGGEIVYFGTTEGLWESNTITGRYFSSREKLALPDEKEVPSEYITLKNTTFRNLKGIDVSIPINRLTMITGVSGSGKSTLIEEVLVPSLKKNKPIGCEEVFGRDLKPVIVDQNPIGRNPRSNPTTYTKLSDIIRDIYASETDLSASHFSFNRPEGACSNCNGIGALEVKMRYLPSTWIKCSTCDGERFSDEVLARKVQFNSKKLSIADFYKLNVSQALQLIKDEKRLSIKNRNDAIRILQAMTDVGLDYLPLGQPSTTLSGGEAQRVKLAKFLGQSSLADRLIILDEPTTGLHTYDIRGLLKVLTRLINSGATIVVVEHNLDIIRAADWIIDLGPGAGDLGGQIIFAGKPKDIHGEKTSLTGQALKDDMKSHPRFSSHSTEKTKINKISIKGARINNLKNIDVEFPKNKLSVVTGVSGSGKSSLISNTLELEARRRYLEMLSLYERQGLKEGPEAPVDSITGLGVTIAVGSDGRRYNIRQTVGLETELSFHLAVLFANIGEKYCLNCQTKMIRADTWICPNCKATEPIAKVRRFSPNNYAAACKTCNGVGNLRKPVPEKLIIHPEKPICKGAMFSPGFFPFGYICKEFNGGYYIIQALAERYNFDPVTTPWNQMTKEAQHAFLFGDSVPLEGVSIGRKGHRVPFKQKFNGFYGWIRDWDVGGTYTETQICPSCNGGRLKPEYLSVKINGYNIHELKELALEDVEKTLRAIDLPSSISKNIRASLSTSIKRLEFLRKVGLGYINLNRVFATLSAGEAQRVKLASLLGSGLTSLTILLDEPTRGMHPSEVRSLIESLKELRTEGNNVIIVEHDPVVIQAADYIVDIGPRPGIAGGEVVAKGTISEIKQSKSITAEWLNTKRTFNRVNANRKPRGWLEIHGASAYNLKEKLVKIPLGLLVGFCGVSGSGKSTLLIDTLGRALVPKKHTTSVAYEPIDPCEHGAIIGAPEETIVIDQTKRGIRSPLSFLGLSQALINVFVETEDAQRLDLDKKQLTKACSSCKGRGYIFNDMEFLPSIRTICDTCRGSGHIAEVWDIKYKGYSLPDVYNLTIDEAYNLFEGKLNITLKLKLAIDVGLGYLVLRQPSYSLSGGEAQRLKIALELSKKAQQHTLYILDEPTLGQHLDDIKRLISILHKLVSKGHSVIVIEHNPDLLAACDYIIELGPGGGPEGGKVIASGTPDEIAHMTTPSAPYIRNSLEVQK
ncbi:MAG: ATP-binding cassette domain-containing protein [Asgard group archaeon]|nr:ATP-binding cassette domain-containing protein [Asgard group archaeon]